MRDDLENRIGEKLRLWVRDSRELFDAGRLAKRTAIEAIIAQLLYGVTYMIARHMPQAVDKDFVEAFGGMLTDARKALHQKKQKES